MKLRNRYEATTLGLQSIYCIKSIIDYGLHYTKPVQFRFTRFILIGVARSGQGVIPPKFLENIVILC